MILEIPMKIIKVEISTWRDDSVLEHAVNWPHVQQQIGIAKMQWLIDLPLTLGQLVLEKIGSKHKLIAEFYTHRTFNDFLMT